jgi:cell division septation protein DedD
MARKGIKGGKKKPAKPASAPSERRDMAFRYGMIVLISIWMFILGVMVGRGTAPVRFDMEKIQEELAALKNSAIQKEMQRYRIKPEEEKKPQLHFYNDLKAPADKVPLHIPKAKPPEPPQERREQSEIPAQKPAESPPPARHKVSLKKSTRDHASPPKKTVAAAPKNAKYTIQVASLKDKAEAQKMVAQLKKKGYPAYRALGKIPGKGVWYRVRVGGYPSKAEALPMLRRLKQQQFNAIVIRK